MDLLADPLALDKLEVGARWVVFVLEGLASDICGIPVMAYVPDMSIPYPRLSGTTFSDLPDADVYFVWVFGSMAHQNPALLSNAGHRGKRVSAGRCRSTTVTSIVKSGATPGSHTSGILHHMSSRETW